MNPDAPTAPYGPLWPATARGATAAARAERPAVVLLAVLVWAVTALSVSFVGGLGCVALFWTAGAGGPVGGILLLLLPIPAGAAALVALARAPRVRALTGSARMLLLGALACPVPAGLAVWLWGVSGA
ncbi:hypothetical protein ACFYUL_25185 [Streptomyces sp. NPDC004311]|uniref:hypothetical protein n=1 Tax=Streptomyces sp. NPDC004311 TaxID=3364698 RepID=UPI003696B50F